MTTPYQLLGVSDQATDAEIKLAYLNRIKDNPPDRDQERFQQIQQAYESIKDNDSRLSYELFHLPESDFNELLDHAFRQNSELKAISPEDFFKLLNTASIDNAITNTIKSKAL